MDKSWIIKHLPKSSKDVVGREKELDLINKYLGAAKFNAKQKPILLAGPPGSGKTSIIYAIANEYDFEVVEVNASDVRNKDAIMSTIGAALKQQSLFFKGKLVLIDEVDGVAGNKDRGGVATLVKLIKEAKHPMIFTANDANKTSLKALRKVCQVITLEPLSYNTIFDRLKIIAEKEFLTLNDDDLKKIARAAGGDLRAAINDLQTSSISGNVDLIGDREQKEAIENALLRVFKTTSASVALPAFDNVPEDLDKIFLWIDENLPKEYTKPEDLARAYDALAEADKFFGRIRRWQYYRFYVYCYNLVSAGIALAKDEKYKTIITFKQSERPLKIWILNNANAKKKAIASKIAEKTHNSTRRVIQDVLPYFMFACKNDNFLTKLEKDFGLDNEEVAWLKKKAF